NSNSQGDEWKRRSQRSSCLPASIAPQLRMNIANEQFAEKSNEECPQALKRIDDWHFMWEPKDLCGNPILELQGLKPILICWLYVVAKAATHKDSQVVTHTPMLRLPKRQILNANSEARKPRPGQAGASW